MQIVQAAPKKKIQIWGNCEAIHRNQPNKKIKIITCEIDNLRNHTHDRISTIANYIYPAWLSINIYHIFPFYT